jgi:membrane-bound lytic murein transglycosylase D
MHDCFRFGRLICLVTALFISAGIFGCATTESNPATGPSTQAGKPAVSAQVHRPVNQGPVTASYYPPPKIDFCGEPVPLENQDVFERFDKEFTLVVYNHAQVYWWLKHKERYFPRFEEGLRRLNLPDDLKYVAIAEIEPQLNAPAKRKSVETGYDFRISPDSAFLHLGDLYRNFNSWSCAIAAYNCGEKCVMDESRAQGVRDCYQMVLPQETERYVFRILAIKAVLSDPARYGYELPKTAGSSR